MRVGHLTSEVVLFSVVAFKTLDISQDSVATHLRYGGIFVLLQIFSRFWQWNNFENRLIFGKVKAYIKIVPNFLGHPVDDLRCWRCDAKHTMMILTRCVTGFGFSSSSVSCHAFASCWICIIGWLPRDSCTTSATTSTKSHWVSIRAVMNIWFVFHSCGIVGQIVYSYSAE